MGPGCPKLTRLRTSRNPPGALGSSVVTIGGSVVLVLVVVVVLVVEVSVTIVVLDARQSVSPTSMLPPADGKTRATKGPPPVSITSAVGGVPLRLSSEPPPGLSTSPRVAGQRSIML